MTRRAWVIVWCAIGISWGQAHATEQLPPGHYPAVLVCPKLAEDSAGHVKAVGDYPPADGVFVYRCKRGGY